MPSLEILEIELKYVVSLMRPRMALFFLTGMVSVCGSNLVSGKTKNKSLVESKEPILFQRQDVWDDIGTKGSRHWLSN